LFKKEDTYDQVKIIFNRSPGGHVGDPDDITRLRQRGNHNGHGHGHQDSYGDRYHHREPSPDHYRPA